jgi:hypothetical protein
MSAGGTLAGAPTWPLWPGAVRHVQSESLKAHRTVSSAVYQLPAWRSATARGLDKPKPEEIKPCKNSSPSVGQTT